MSLLSDLALYRRLHRSQWLDRAALRRLQERKLRRIVTHAYRTVPFYRARLDDLGVTPEDIRSLDDLPRLPLIAKRDMQTAGPNAIASDAFAPETLVAETTSGSSGRPFTVRCDPRWLGIRRALFARALATAGYRPGRKTMMLTGAAKPRASWLRVRYVPFATPPETVLAEFNRFRPWLVYGWASPLRRLALYARERGAGVHRPGAVVTTAESLDTSTRTLLEDTFGTTVFDVYGLTEMGIIGWECPAHCGYHLAEDTVLAEFLEPDGPGGAPRLVLTNLELFGTPFIRYETGDLAEPGSSDTCTCGRTFRRMQKIEGRRVDCVRLRDGRVILPYQLTLELERVPGLQRYRIVQDDLDAFTVHYESRRSCDERTAADARQALARVLGPEPHVRVERHTSLDPPPGCKFRVVECRVPTGTPQT